jgi:hypothetical protein
MIFFLFPEDGTMYRNQGESIGRASATNEGEEKSMQNFCGKALRKGTTNKT